MPQAHANAIGNVPEGQSNQKRSQDVGAGLFVVVFVLVKVLVAAVFPIRVTLFRRGKRIFRALEQLISISCRPVPSRSLRDLCRKLAWFLPRLVSDSVAAPIHLP